MKHYILAALIGLGACSKMKTDKPKAPENKASVETTAPAPAIKLYALDCGRIDMLDLSLFDRGGAFDGRTNKAADTCYLIRHPKGDLLWDTGLPDSLSAVEGGVTNGPFHLEVVNTLASQLEGLGIKPEDIEYLSLSHPHFDHLGNGGAYAGSTFIVNSDEKAFMFRDDAKKDDKTFPAYSALEQAKTIEFKGQYDVFSDGSVTIIDMPGHTPGHTVLKVELPKTGTVLLTGDLYHLNESRKLRTVPVFNTDPEETLRSMDKFEALAKKTNAKVIIQHSKSDFDALPKPPAYLD